MRIHKLIDYLSSQGVLGCDCRYQQITVGSGGAAVYSIQDTDGEYVLKAAGPTLHTDPTVMASCHREFHFYCLNRQLQLPFVPETVFLEQDTPWGLIILMKKYRPIPPASWTPALLHQAIKIIADLHCLPADHFRSLGVHRQDVVIDSAVMKQGCAMWQKVISRFPGAFNSAELQEIYENIHIVCDILNAGPFCISHGDCHPENFLAENGSLFLCDWQNVGIGGRAGDLSFFLSRAGGFGMEIDEAGFVDEYCHCMAEHGIAVHQEQIRSERCASDLLTTFAYWAEYLQDAPYDKVTRIYQSMVNAYRYLKQG